jgi:hypothetical protein
MFRNVSLLVLASVLVAGDVILAALGHDVPSFLSGGTVAAIGAVAGVALPKSGGES